jgi:hypothetical protein
MSGPGAEAGKNPGMSRFADLTVLADGTIVVSAAGIDDARTHVTTFIDGSVVSIEPMTGGTRHVTYRDGEFIDTALIVDPHVSFDSAQDSFGGPWVEGKRSVRLRDGRFAEVTVNVDASGHKWESGKVPQHIDAHGRGIPGRDWLRILHPPGDRLHPSSDHRGETIELGRSRYVFPSGRVDDHNYTTVGRREVDSMGRDTRVHVTSGYSPATGEETHWSSVKANDGTSSYTHVTRQTDGHWSIVTVTRDAHGHGTKHTVAGRGEQVTRDETEDVDDTTEDDGGSNDGNDDGHGSHDGPEDDGSDAPVGDGEGTSEGNPDAGLPFDRVSLARLLGPDWDLGEELDTLGDVEAHLRPWIERIVAAARSGTVGVHEELDTLGAPPVIGFDLTGYEHDEMEELDSLGRPPPIFHSTVEIDTAGEVTSLVALEGVASSFATAAATLIAKRPP